MKEIRGSKVLDLLWASPGATGGAFSVPYLEMYPRVGATISYDIMTLLSLVADNARARAGRA